VIESYSNGTLVFTVSGFSTYTIDEAPAQAAAESAPKPKKKNSPAAKSDSPAKTDDAELIKILTAQLNVLITELNRLTGGGNSSFTADLSVGVSHPDVLKLQKFLNSKGFSITTSGPGSLGNETMFYGAKTAAAVKRFQMSKGIKTTGNVGPLTRAALNAI
jgi:peptidoglycan hydrolase-like protein with peptidoglycan-binding domain